MRFLDLLTHRKDFSFQSWIVPTEAVRRRGGAEGCRVRLRTRFRVSEFVSVPCVRFVRIPTKGVSVS